MTAVLPHRRRTPSIPAVARWAGLPVVLAVILSCAVVSAGLLGPLPVPLAMAGAVLIGTAPPVLRLFRLALALHQRTGTLSTCRGAGFLALGTLVGTVTVTAAVLSPAAARPAIAVGGLMLAFLCHTTGIVLLPDAASTPSTRLRRLVDGASLGISLAFAGWLSLPAGQLPTAALAAASVGVGGLSVVTVTALSMARHRPSVLYCGGGAAIAMLGLAALTVLFAYDQAPVSWLGAVAPIVAGPVLILAGTPRTVRAVPPQTASLLAGQLSAYPLLTVPAVVATLAAVYHLFTAGQFDRTSILLGLAVIPTLVVREVMAAIDVRAFARRLAAQEAHFRSLVSEANDLTMVVGDDLIVRWQSPAAARLFGLADADVVGRAFPDLMHPEDATDVTILLTGVLAGRLPSTGRPPLVTARLLDGHGMWRDTESTVSDQRSVPEVAALVVHVRDIGERLRLERTLHQMAFTDQVTGLANRRELMRTIVTQRGIPGHIGALLVIDLHGMAAINDQHGREIGDAVLVEVGRRMRCAVGSDDVVARLAGDEFAVVTVAGPVFAFGLGTRLITVLSEPYPLPDAVGRLQVSIGMAEVAGGDGVDEVLGRADLARRRARQVGRNRIEWYDMYVEEQLVRRLDLERELPGAVERGELDVVYQPVLALSDGQPVGVEALVRWRSRLLGTVLPAELIPVAEALSVMGEIGQWMRTAACRQLASWSREGHELWLAVNVTPGELAAPEFLTGLQMSLVSQGIAPDRLVVEVAQPRVAAHLPALMAPLAELRRQGVRVALDDFGAGQASLAQLRRLPLDMLKIDRALLADLNKQHGGHSRPMIDVVVGLGRRLGLEIVAEGLESTAQVEQARSAGCRYGQGYALSRPAPAERTEAFLAEFPV